MSRCLAVARNQQRSTGDDAMSRYSPLMRSKTFGVFLDTELSLKPIVSYKTAFKTELKTELRFQTELYLSVD